MGIQGYRKKSARGSALLFAAALWLEIFDTAGLPSCASAVVSLKHRGACAGLALEMRHAQIPSCRFEKSKTLPHCASYINTACYSGVNLKAFHRSGRSAYFPHLKDLKSRGYHRHDSCSSEQRPFCWFSGLQSTSKATSREGLRNDEKANDRNGRQKLIKVSNQ